MLSKLAFRNVRQSFRDYSVYFFTLVMGVCVFYLFNSIYAQQELMEVTQTSNQSMQLLQRVLSGISVFVAIVLGFLIVYANRFFIRRRKKELGIYLTLGMNRGSISLILVLETCLLALAALVVGLVLGVLGSQVMSVFTAKIFEADLTGHRFVFSLEATEKSILYFGIIFLVVLLFNVYTVGKCKLIDLLYGGRRNERQVFPSTVLSGVLFAVSVVFLVTAYVMILHNGLLNFNIWFVLSLILGILGTLLFYFSLAGLLTALLQRWKNFYFRGLNLFVLRQLSNKINTNFISVSVVSLTLLLVIGIFSSGYSLQNALSKDLRKAVPYDFSLCAYTVDETDVPSIAEHLPADLLSNQGIDDYEEFAVYQSNATYGQFGVEFDSDSYGMRDDMFVRFVPLSSYNAALRLAGKDIVDLQESEYLISVAEPEYLLPAAAQLLEQNITISIDEVTLSPVGIADYSIANGSLGLFLIVEDNLLKEYPVILRILNIQCRGESAEEAMARELDEYLQEVYASGSESYPAFSFYASRLKLYTQSVTTKALFSFLGIYLGFVFMIVSAAILSIQQLSEAADNRERYLLLQKLGVERRMIHRALFTQILCYFLFPLLLAIIHSAVGLTAANEVIALFGKVDVRASLAATSAFLVVIYGIYFYLTYTGSKAMLRKD